MKKSIIITIDTEGDNLWNWKVGDKVTTENAKYLPRFQSLCEEYGLIPTYLANYEMASDSFFIEYFGKKQEEGKCEIGMHLHAWNSPPYYELPIRSDVKPGAPYLIEYPEQIMEDKIGFMTELITENFGIKPMSHRAGRWAMNDTYFNLLGKYGYKMDCSVTPGVDWSNAAGQTINMSGSNYCDASTRPSIHEPSGILEVPVTIRESHRIKTGLKIGIRSNIRTFKSALDGHGKIWFRPNSSKDSLNDMLYLKKCIEKEKTTDYLMFMIHSSELMPAGSPRFPSEESIEKLYLDLRTVFSQLSSFTGTSLKGYIQERR